MSISSNKKYNSRKNPCRNVCKGVFLPYRTVENRKDVKAMDMMVFWLILTIICIVVEVGTVGLVSIWFAGGALIACFLDMAGLHVIVQVIVFLVVSLLLLAVTRPLAKTWLNTNRTKTNYEGIIGKVVRVTEKIDNFNETGTALVNGQEWTARSENDNISFEQGELAQVINIAGVKLIVKKYED